MAKLLINAGEKKGHINEELYGHFSEHLGRCIYEGIYVGEHSKIPNKNGMRSDVVEALRKMKIPVLRWPGGCFADEYHWEDGIGPREKRKKMINTHWGGVVEDNSFGTHEFMELCSQLGCKAYINGNLGSGTVREMSEWVEYLTFEGISPMADLRKRNGREKPWNIEYFGVGNENWGCGGNMTPGYYANEYRRYQTYVRNYDDDKKIYKIACGANIDDYQWTEEVMKIACDYMDGLSLHYYTHPEGWDAKGSSTEFDDRIWYKTLSKTLKMEELITRHGAIMDKYDPNKRIGMIIDEWGTWFTCEPGTNPGFLYQQNTMRDALAAGINLNIFNKNCSRVKMANLAQIVNVLQAVILTEGEKMIVTPTYHVFSMYKEHQNGTLLGSYLEKEEIGLDKDYMVPNLSESASMDQKGRVHLTINNLSSTESYEVESTVLDKTITYAEAEILTNEIQAKNTFECPGCVVPAAFTDYKITKKGINFKIPPSSVLHITIE